MNERWSRRHKGSPNREDEEKNYGPYRLYRRHGQHGVCAQGQNGLHIFMMVGSWGYTYTKTYRYRYTCTRVQGSSTLLSRVHKG